MGLRLVYSRTLSDGSIARPLRPCVTRPTSSSRPSKPHSLAQKVRVLVREQPNAAKVVERIVEKLLAESHE